MKRVAVLQSCYIPWVGYFDLLDRVDALVVLDDVQYTRNDWRNRNRIKAPGGARWLTVPVLGRGHLARSIDAIETDGDVWRRKHWTALRHSYARAPFFRRYADRFEHAYLGRPERCLSAVNRGLTQTIMELLGIATPLVDVRALGVPGGERNHRLVQLCRSLDADVYLSGPSARAYLDTAAFERAGIRVEWMTYEYGSYPQLHPPFDPAVSVLDALFTLGPGAVEWMRAGRRS